MSLRERREAEKRNNVKMWAERRLQKVRGHRWKRQRPTGANKSRPGNLVVSYASRTRRWFYFFSSYGVHDNVLLGLVLLKDWAYFTDISRSVSPLTYIVIDREELGLG